MDNILSFFENTIDWILVLLILISSYWVKKNFTDIFPKISLAHKILIWCTLLTIFYVITLNATQIEKTKSLSSYLITYFFATSFYELLWKQLIDYVEKKVGATPDQNKP